MNILKRLKKKRKSKSGFTLAEMLIAIALLVIFSTAVVSGMSVAANSYYDSVIYGEAGILSSTISNIVIDELRYASDIDSDTMTFTSSKYGPGVRFEITDGKITLGGYRVLSDATYTNNLTANIEYNYSDGVFDVKVEIINASEKTLKTAEFKVKNVNS